MPTFSKTKRLPWIVPAAVIVALAAGVMVGGAGLGYRAGLLDLGAAFKSMTWGTYTAIAGVLLCVVAAVAARPGRGRKGFLAALLGLVVAGVAFYLPFSMRQTAQALPRIHDISTDTEDPPQFVAVLPLRAGASNPPDYAGPEVAAQQRAAYPDLAPLDLPLPPDQAVAKAAQAAEAMGWDVVAVEPAEGRVEATDTTTWWGFKDDLVIRVRDNGQGGSRVDVRSKSRVGLSDLGANAARIRDYLASLR